MINQEELREELIVSKLISNNLSLFARNIMEDPDKWTPKSISLAHVVLNVAMNYHNDGLLLRTNQDCGISPKAVIQYKLLETAFLTPTDFLNSLQSALELGFYDL